MRTKDYTVCLEFVAVIKRFSVFEIVEVMNESAYIFLRGQLMCGP